jgi:hypothetical protein
MQQHKYHRFFLPILIKLYKESKNDTYIDISECLTGTDEQNTVIVRNLRESEFAIVKKEAAIYLGNTVHKKPKYLAKILPLGIDYLENLSQEIQNANRKIPPVGFKTKG